MAMFDKGRRGRIGEPGAKGYRGDIGEPGVNGRDGYEFRQKEYSAYILNCFTPLATMAVPVHLVHGYISPYKYIISLLIFFAGSIR